MRLFFIPGFGEEPAIFDKVHPAFSSEKVFVDHWELLGNEPRPTVDALIYARELVSIFDIQKNDVLVGHSMGGWIAWYAKHLVGCRVVQIASWTDPRKVVSPISRPSLIYWLAKSGLYFNRVMMQYFLWQNYYKKPSAEIYLIVFKRLISGNNANAVNQLRVIFNPIREAAGVEPDLRIHSKADTTILFPDEPTQEVPGDHFNLWTHPAPINQAIQKLLAQLVG